MAHRKAGGTARNLRDSNPKYLGVKLQDGQVAKAGCILVRQRGTKFYPGENVRIGRDDTLFSTIGGIVKFTQKRKIRYDGKINKVSFVSVTPLSA